MNRLYIRTHEAPIREENAELEQQFSLEDQFEWLLLSSACDVLNQGKGKSAAQLQAFLAEQGLSYGELVFIPPENRVQVRRVALEKGQQRHAEQVIPFLLEESLAQAPDELHYTLLNKANKSSLWVSIIAKEVLSAWLHDLAQMGWQQAVILPVNSMLPFWPEQDLESDFVFTSQQSILYKDQDSVSCLPLAAQSYLPKRDKYNLCCDSTMTAEFAELAPTFELLSPWSEHERNQQGKLESWFYMIASKIQANSQFLLSNVCHGEFGRQTAVWSKVKPWIWVFSFALFSLATELVLTYQATQSLNEQAEDIYQKTSQAFLKLAPDEGRVSYLDRQIKGRIQRAKQGLTGEQKSLTVYEVMGLIDQVRASVKADHRITKLDYANKEFRLDWQAPEKIVLDQIQVELEKRPLHVVVEQVAKRGEVYVASIKLKEETL